MALDPGAKSQAFVYHRVPPNLRGRVLYPLNQLKAVSPDLYIERRKSYASREDIASLRIPPLGNCLWNDVLHFSAVHPARIMAALQQASHALPEDWHQFFEIDARLLDPAATVIYDCRTVFWSGEFDIAVATRQLGRECLAFDPGVLRGFTEVTPLAREHYSSVKPGSNVLLFLGIPHVLFRGRLDLDQEGVRVIEV